MFLCSFYVVVLTLLNNGFMMFDVVILCLSSFRLILPGYYY